VERRRTGFFAGVSVADSTCNAQAERIELASGLWDSIAAETGVPALTEFSTAKFDHWLGEIAGDSGSAGS